MKKKTEKEPSIFRQEVRRDINTFKRLKGKQRLQFVWDYFRYKIIVAIFCVIVVAVFAVLLYQGQMPCRLRVCAVLNNEEDCQSWFDEFQKELTKDGNTAPVSVNQDQPFDYDNKYYYVMELEVMTTVSSHKMDVAICGPDMYDYLLAINACQALDQVLTEEETEALKDSDMLVMSTANLQYQEDGTLDTSNAVDGYFALDISDTEFGQKYNQDQELDEGEEASPLYAIIISNTNHMDDAVSLIEALSK